jgi:hypothetical protein
VRRGRCSRLLADSPPLFPVELKQEGAKSNRNTPSPATARTVHLRGDGCRRGHRVVSRRFWVAASPALVLFCHLRCFNFLRTRSPTRKEGAEVVGSRCASALSRFDSDGTAAICNAAAVRRRHKNERNNLHWGRRRFRRRRVGERVAAAGAQLRSKSQSINERRQFSIARHF